MQLKPQKTAFISLDFQNGIIDMVVGAEVAISSASTVMEFAREKNFHIIHVGLGFSEGHPEIPDVESHRFAPMKKNNLFIKGSSSAQFHSSIAKPGELVVYKQRYSAFSENQLQMILRSRRIENLVLFGISTSGIALSTLRQAFDLDFHCTIIKDACFDRDPEVHRVLTEKIFPVQATVLTAEDFIAQQSGA